MPARFLFYWDILNDTLYLEMLLLPIPHGHIEHFFCRRSGDRAPSYSDATHQHPLCRIRLRPAIPSAPQYRPSSRAFDHNLG